MIGDYKSYLEQIPSPQCRHRYLWTYTLRFLKLYFRVNSLPPSMETYKVSILPMVFEAFIYGTSQ